MTFRVPLLNLQRSFNSNYKILEFVRKFKIFSFSRVLRIRFPFGFSSRMILLLWCVCGGFLQHFYDSSFLDILLKRNYEDPVDTAQDILDRGLTVIFTPGTESIVEILKNSPSEVTRTLAERTIVAKVIILFGKIPILIFLLRIGTNTIRWFKRRVLTALLLLNVVCCTIISWSSGDGIEAGTGEVVTTHLVPTC